MRARRALLALLAVLVAGLAAGCGASGGAATAPGGDPLARGGEARSDPFAIVADSPDGRARALLAPGSIARVALRVANASGAPRTFVLRTTDPRIALPDRVAVGPRASAPVTATVRAPRHATREVRTAAVVARAHGRGDGPVVVSYESRVPLVIEVRP
jgi:hypothetical protein